LIAVQFCETGSVGRAMHKEISFAQRDFVLLFADSFALYPLCSCRTVPPLPAVNLAEPGWRVQRGQAVWRSRQDAPEIAGELLVATHSDGRAFLQFTKTPLPLVVAQTTSNAWRIQFVAEGKSWSAPGKPPAQLAWLQLLRCVRDSAPPANWHWRPRDDGHWRLENNVTGEMLEGYLTP